MEISNLYQYNSTMAPGTQLGICTALLYSPFTYMDGEHRVNHIAGMGEGVVVKCGSQEVKIR